MARLLPLLLLSACMEQAPVRIVQPAAGATIQGNAPVRVVVESDADEVWINGKPAAGDGPFSATVPPAAGLGVVVAQVPGEELLAIRSWHQGTLRDGRDWQSNNLALQLGQRALSTGPASVASLIAELLRNEELRPFVNNPLKIDINTLVQLTIVVKSAKTDKVAVALKLDAKGLHFVCTLRDVKVSYTAKAVTTLVHASGIAHFKEIQIAGDMVLSPQQVRLTKITTKATAPVLQDTSGLPASYAKPLIGLLDKDVTKSMADAAARAAQRVFSHLLQEIRPRVGVTFKQPITQSSTLERISVVRPALIFWYRVLIRAAVSEIAREGQRLVSRPLGALAVPTHGALGAYCGSGLVNQFAFAVWDAGNLEGLSFNRQQLQQLGMTNLEFPYTYFERASLRLLLPPLLTWGADGPRLAIGGVKAHIQASVSDDVTAWTAASVPVHLARVGDGLRLLPDPKRKVDLAAVGFDQLSEFADQKEVLRILGTAVPGVIRSVFGSLPAIQLPALQLTRLDGSKGPALTPALLAVTRRPDHWQIEVELRRK